MLELIIVLAVIVAVVGPIIFWVTVFFAAKRFFSAYENAAREQEHLINQLIQAQNLGAGAGSGAGPVPAELQSQFFAAAARAQQSMSHLNGIHRQRAELRQSELMGMAAQAGIDPPSF